MYIFHSYNCADHLALVSFRMSGKKYLAKCIDVIYNRRRIYITNKKKGEGLDALIKINWDEFLLTATEYLKIHDMCESLSRVVPLYLLTDA